MVRAIPSGRPYRPVTPVILRKEIAVILRVVAESRSLVILREVAESLKLSYKINAAANVPKITSGMSKCKKVGTQVS